MSENSPESGSDESDGTHSEFETFVVQHFGPDPRPEFTSPIAPTGVILCFVNRSASNYLAESLASSGNFPRAREFFLKQNLLRQKKNAPDLSSIFEKIVRKHTRNEIFAAKLGFSQLSFFESRGFLNAAFDRTKFIYLKRCDVLAQAISLEIASQNQQWRSDPAAEKQDLHYSRKRIELKMLGIEKKYQRFENFFATRHLTPFAINHEELVRRPAESIASIGNYLGCPIQLDSSLEHSKKPRATLKEAWKHRFLSGD